MADRNDTVRRSIRGSGVGRGTPSLVLPLLALVGTLAATQLVSANERCGGPIPGCSALSNAGELAVTVRAAASGTAAERPQRPLTVEAGTRAHLLAPANEIRVDAGQCLLVEGGPWWTTRTLVDRLGSARGQWHVIDDWGARVRLSDSACPGASPGPR